MATIRSRPVSQRHSSRRSTASARAARARSRAAKKGWATRRAAARQRSLAAKKGWTTRRENLAHATRLTHKSRLRHTPRASTRNASSERTEYAVSADYRSRKAGNAVAIQVSAIGPRGASRDDAERATIDKINTGRNPRGWTIKIVEWRGRTHTDSPNAWSDFSGPLALARLEVSQVGRSKI